MSECKAYIGMEQDVRTTHFQGQPIYLDSHCMILVSEKHRVLTDSYENFIEILKKKGF